MVTGNFSNDDIDAIERAMDNGQVKPVLADHSIIVETKDDIPFHPTVFPCVLSEWKSTRLGDISLTLIIPHRFRAMTSELQLALRRRLMVSMEEYDPR